MPTRPRLPNAAVRQDVAADVATERCNQDLVGFSHQSWVLQRPSAACATQLTPEPSGGTGVHVHSFAPVVDESSSVLILGSMPGKASLRAGQYYAHPRNAFWKMIEAVLGIEQDAPYQDRIDVLLERRIALWDVLKSCTRASSLDSDIIDSSIVVNDFASFFSRYPKIATVFFNGAKAESSFRKLVLPTLLASRHLALHRLPSTSPANASIPYDRKLEEWGLVVHAT